MNKFKPGDKVRRLPKYRGAGFWNRGDEVMTVVGYESPGWLQLEGYGAFDDGRFCYAGVAAERFELASALLWRDRLMMDLLAAGASRQAAEDFVRLAPDYRGIAAAYRPGSAECIIRLVVWGHTPQGHDYWAAIYEKAAS